MKFQEKLALNPRDESAESILDLSDRQLKHRFQHSSITGSNRQSAASTRVYESQCIDSAWPSSSSNIKTPRTTQQQPGRPPVKTERGGTPWARFCQGFSNHHDQIPATSPSEAYSPPSLALVVTVCASTFTLLLYFILSLQPYSYIVHWNENWSDCTLLYNCKVPNPPPRETVTLTSVLALDLSSRISRCLHAVYNKKYIPRLCWWQKPT